MVCSELLHKVFIGAEAFVCTIYRAVYGYRAVLTAELYFQSFVRGSNECVSELN